ncbi:MAG: TolC family protein [Victivallales bacterium]|nr:TolC family protein [Victivallales bacterium]
MKIIRLLGIFSILAFCGCQTVKNARDIQDNTTPVAGEFTPSAAELGLTADKTFSLEELQLIALKCHPSIRTAINDVETAALNVKKVKADFLPSINAGISHKRTTANRNAHHQRSYTDGTWNGSLSLQLMIFDFGKTDAQVRQLMEIYKAKLQQLKNARNNVVGEVRKAYFQLNRAIELEAVAKETVKQFEEHRDQVKMKKEVGAGTSYDLTKAEVDVYNAILSENVARNNIDIAWASLTKAIGLAEKASFKVTNASLKEYSLDVNDLLELANIGNPTLASLKISEEAASIYVDKTIADLYPTFSLELGATLSGNSPSLPLIWNLTGLASVTQNIFNGNRNMIAIQQATLELKNARASRTSYEQQLFQLLRTASLNAQLAQQQFKVAQEVEKQSKEYFDLVSTQYSVGKSTALERTDAQVALSNAEAQVVSAKFDYQDALANIATLVGDVPDSNDFTDTDEKPEVK